MSTTTREPLLPTDVEAFVEIHAAQAPKKNSGRLWRCYSDFKDDLFRRFAGRVSQTVIDAALKSYCGRVRL